MTTIRELCNTPVGQITIMAMFKNGRKVADQDISDMTWQELKQAIEEQEMQDREWTYKTISCPYAEFIGLQEDVKDRPPVPLYNIIGGPKHGSTVGVKTLMRLGIKIPS